MSINGETIDAVTIDAGLVSRRQAIIDYLLGPVFPVAVKVPKAIPSIQHRHWHHNHRDSEEHVVVETELPIYSVTITFAGTSFSQAIERTSLDDMALVTVGNILVLNSAPITVNIRNFQVIKWTTSR